MQWIAGMRHSHERMANDMGLIAEDERRIAYSILHEQGATGLWGRLTRESRDGREEREKGGLVSVDF